MTAYRIRQPFDFQDRVGTIDQHELNAFAGDADEGPGAGLLNQVITLDLSELRHGDNELELALAGAWTGSYRAATLGTDVVLSR